jgi:hypothetical protein
MTEADDQPTCGKGLAEHAALPAALAALSAAMAHVLELHVTTLDATDADTRPENEAYGSIATQLRSVSAGLHALAAEMKGYRELPMGRHDEEALGSPLAIEAFSDFVARERELLELMQSSVERDEQMLTQFGA